MESLEFVTDQLSRITMVPFKNELMLILKKIKTQGINPSINGGSQQNESLKMFKATKIGHQQIKLFHGGYIKLH